MTKQKQPHRSEMLSSQRRSHREYIPEPRYQPCYYTLRLPVEALEHGNLLSPWIHMW